LYELFDSKAIFVCNAGRCGARGPVEEIYEHIRAKLEREGLTEEISLMWSNCMRLCDLGPNIMVFPDGEVYSRMTPEKTDAIVDALAKQKLD
jgi:NADP-reducing hydrogenase subunit HndC